MSERPQGKAKADENAQFTRVNEHLRTLLTPHWGGSHFEMGSIDVTLHKDQAVRKRNHKVIVYK